MARTQGVGVMSKELAINAGVTGPMLRASGVNYDLRKVDKYGIYDRFAFKVPLGEHGDVYDRYMIRLLEMRESVKILNQALQRHSRRPDHRSQDEDSRIPAETRRSLRPHRIAQRRAGLLSDQRRLGQSVSLSRAFLLPDQPDRAGDMCIGHNVADVVVILGSIDIVMGEVDR